MGYKEIRDSLKGLSEKILDPIIALLKFLHLTPNAVTWLGFIINIAGAYYIVKGGFLTAGLIIIAAGIFDMLDGALARKTGKKSKQGGFLDSTTDRFSEGVLYLAILYFYLRSGDQFGVILAYLAMLLSFLISYIRARASGLKIDCEIGLFTRPERILALVLGLLVNQLFYAMIIIAALSFVTVVQRFVLVMSRAATLDKKN